MAPDRVKIGEVYRVYGLDAPGVHSDDPVWTAVVDRPDGEAWRVTDKAADLKGKIVLLVDHFNNKLFVVVLYDTKTFRISPHFLHVLPEY